MTPSPTSNATHKVQWAPAFQYLSNIEQAARAGYEDARVGSGFRPEYDVQIPQWQRNYEIGRLWATGMKCVDVALEPWIEGTPRPPNFQSALAAMTRALGSIVPQKETVQAAEPDLVLLAQMPMRGRDGRIRERVA